ncbi:hypothetical protein MNBD_UNCLBAC01-1467 [hydrothermal vent metagenome]|uniref:ParD protein (Antitoxin to ParE) n=1 Tax=hydrothermal vent metagenome TaxID=652676 RepID=A0A3B1D287_9ZZZZ
MTRQSISLTTPNDEWLNFQVSSEEYSTKSEAVNDLIRKERWKEKEIEFIRAKLIKSEQSGFVDQNRDEILAEFKNELKLDAKL